MAADKTIPEREAVERERQAWLDGYMGRCMVENNTVVDRATGRVEPRKLAGIAGVSARETGLITEAARLRYPMPKVTRPRVLHEQDGDTRYEYRYVNGQYECRLETPTVGRTWGPLTVVKPSPSIVNILHDLWSQPDEEVEA